MFTFRLASDRGHANHGWLDTWHSFSFANYFDPEHMGFRVLRVINEDRVAAEKGFGMHPHRDMEIVTYVLSGKLEHRDSMGNGEVIQAGEVQQMTAGTGVMHSEFNPSTTEAVHLYQIWLLPDQRGREPRYAQRSFPKADRAGRWQLIVSPDGRGGSLPIHQDATIELAELAAGAKLARPFATGRHGWLQVLRGSLEAAGRTLSAGDAVAISTEPSITLVAKDAAEVMMFDLP